MAIINDAEFKERYRLVGDSLKSMPKGFDKNSPYGEYIKKKEYLVSMPVRDDYFLDENWVERVANDFKFIKPFNDFLNYVFEM